MFSGVIERLHHFIIHDLLLLVCGDVRKKSLKHIYGDIIPEELKLRA